MHVLQYVLVSAETPGEAALMADSHDADWSDWHEVGGRWSGLFNAKFPGELFPEDGNVLSYREHPAYFVSTIRETMKAQRESFREACDALLGNEVLATNVSGYILGIPVADTEAHARSRTLRNRETADAWQRVLASPDIPEYSDSSVLSALMHVDRIKNLIFGGGHSEAGYLDTVAYQHPRDLLQALESGETSYDGESLESLHLVAVDYHY